jgi:hypothetical protein
MQIQSVLIACVPPTKIIHGTFFSLLVSGWVVGFFELQIRPVMFYATIVGIKMRGVRHNISADNDEYKRGHKMGRTSTCRHPFWCY